MLDFFFNRKRPPAEGTAEIGILGENAAERFLKKKKYRVLAKNWRSGKDEIDLVCSFDGALVFVEVKTRKLDALVSGYDSVDTRKKKALLRVCRAYLYKLKGTVQVPRFDIVEVEHDAGVICEIRHFENVPLFPKHVSRGV